MLRHIVLSLVFGALCLSAQLNAQKNQPKAAGPSTVEGLQLPEVVNVIPQSEFTTISAKTTGTVKWAVISDKNVKYLEDSEKKSIMLGSIPDDSNIMVIAVANINGKITDFASTKVVFGKNAQPTKEIPNEKLNYRIRWH